MGFKVYFDSINDGFLSNEALKRGAATLPAPAAIRGFL
jgi:hypothetical protein